MKSITRIFFHAENHVAIQGLELHFVNLVSCPGYVRVQGPKVCGKAYQGQI